MQILAFVGSFAISFPEFAGASQNAK